MVPPHARINRPIPEVVEVLNERRLLQIGAVSYKSKRARAIVDGVVDATRLAWSAVVKLIGIRHDVLRIFVQKRVVGFEAHFPFAASMVERKSPAHVAFAKPVMLSQQDRR